MSRGTVLLVFTLLVGLATAQVGNQQQQQFQRQQRLQQQRPQPQQQVNKGNVAAGGPEVLTGDIDETAVDKKFETVELIQVEALFTHEKSINTLTNCFINRAQCRSESSLNLINQVVNLGPGGQCPPCPPAAQQQILQVLHALVDGFTTKYPRNWQAIYPHVRHVVDGLKRS